MKTKIFLVLFAFYNIANAQGVWNQKANFGGAIRGLSTGFSIGSKGYIGTGIGAGFVKYKDFWEWDQSSNAWTQKADFGGTARYGAVGFSIGTKGYIGTGYDNAHTTDFWEWDQTTNVWTQKAPFSGVARHYAAGFSIGNKGYIGTGVASTGFLNDFWEWDQGANTWVQKTNFGGTARRAPVGFSIAAKGYIGTGCDNVGYVNDFWEWDQSSDAWIQKSNFGGIARNYATGFSIGTKGYIGTGGGGSIYTFDFWEWNQSNNTWTQQNDFPGTPRYNAIGFSIGNKGYISTGSDVSGTTKDFWEYDASCSLNITGSASSISCGSTVSLNAGFTPTTNAVYNWSPSTGLSSTTIANPIASPTSTITYTLVAQDAVTQCTGSAQFKITVVTPSVVISGSTSVNCGGSTTLAASVSPNSGNVNYSWSPSAGLSSANISNPVASPSVTTTYTVIAQDVVTQCIGTAQATITVVPPNLVISGTETTICPQSNSSLTASFSPVGGGSITYSWSPAFGLSNANISNPVASPSITTTYTVTAQNSTTQCYAVSQFTLFVTPINIDWMWAKGGNNNSSVGAESITTDRLGNVYVVGEYYSSITFGSYTLSNSGGSDIFLVKYDMAGNVIWARGSGCGNIGAAVFGVSTDSIGNVYITGGFGCPSITFGSYTLNKASGTIFIVKYDSTGNVLWAKNPNLTYGSSNSIKTDASGNSYITGEFGGASATFGSYVLTNSGNSNFSDAFIAKYDELGNVLWAKSVCAGAETEWSPSISIDSFGNCYIAGYFNSDSIIFGSTVIKNTTTTGEVDVFVAKYNSSGNLVWAKGDGGSGMDWTSQICIDPSGSSYVTGYFRSPKIIFGGDTITKIGDEDVFIVKYDSNGNVVWVKAGHGIMDSGDNRSTGIASDLIGNLYLTGKFSSGSIVFENTTLFCTNSTYTDFFIVKYDSAGNFFWAKGYGSAYEDISKDVTVDDCGNSYFAGEIYGLASVLFGTEVLTPVGPATIFTAKLSWASFATCQTNVTCYGDNDGDAMISVEGGVTPYVYNWSNNQTSQTATGLIAGSYTVTVTDAKGCTASTTVAITQPNAITANVNVINATSCAASDGNAWLSSTAGGTPPYSYLWFNGNTSLSNPGLAPGNYYVTITDANNCTVTKLASVTSGFTASPGITNVSCHGGGNGAINLVTNGSNNLIYNWSTGATTKNVNGLIAGTYTIAVIDTICQDTLYKILNVTEPAILTGSMTVTNATSCTASDGSIVFNVSGGISPYIFSWSNGGISSSIAGLVVGSYTITVIDAKGCTFIGVDTVQCNIPASVQSFNNVQNIYIFPNPTTGIVELKGNLDQIKSLEVYNVFGQKLFSHIPQENNPRFIISSLPNGMYFFHINFKDDIVEIRKIMLNR